jgi:hypothetical protein
MVCRPVSSVVGDRISVLSGWRQTLGSFLDHTLWLFDHRRVQRFCFVVRA